MNNEVIEFKLSEEYIELIKLLKLLNLCESGSEAKYVVDEGMVLCNGETELRKRKKLRNGDIVIFNNIEIKIQ